MLALIKEKITLVEPPSYTIPLEVQVAARNLLAQSASITEVGSAEELDRTTAFGVELHSYLKSVSEARLSLSRPLDNAKARLIDLEKKHCAPLEDEKERLGRLIGSFKRADAERWRAEQSAKNEEIARLLADRNKAEAAAENLNGSKAVVAEQKAYEAEQKIEAVLASPMPQAIKAKGSATRQVLCYGASDLKALYQARPELCLLTLNAAAVRAVCFPPDTASEAEPDLSIPGLKLWWTEHTSFRR